MKSAFLIGIVFLACGAAAENREGNSADEATLVTLGVSGHWTRYSATWDRLRKQPAWGLDAQRFPVPLNDAVLRSLDYFRNDCHITNRLYIGGIRILRPASYTPDWAAHGVSPDDFNRCWVVALRAGSRDGSPIAPGAHFRFAVMLLDGTFAKEGPATVPDAKAGEETGRRSAIPGENATSSNAVTKALEDPNSPVSTVQWNAELQQFPMDLDFQNARAAKVLSGQFHITDPLFLYGVDMCRYVPLRARGLPEELDLNHWYVSFSFGPDPRRHYEATAYTLLMLLDGQITASAAPANLR